MKLLIVLLIAAAAVAGCTSPPATGPNPPGPVISNGGGGFVDRISVSDQELKGATVTIDRVISPGPGWLVIHADDQGKPGGVLGHTAVGEGVSTAVIVTIIPPTDPHVHAMLHADSGTAGVYEFPGPDAPVAENGAVVDVPFLAFPASGIVDLAVTAKQWEFQPSEIRVKRGQRVRLTITSTDVPHGFSIPEYGINTVLQPNQPAVVEFTADTAGTFTASCSVVCGSGHATMKGTLVVE